jgi:tripartite ATP-independent transporter DctP family solute receptor
MKQLCSLFARFAACALACTLIWGLAGPAAAATTHRLIFANYFGPTHPNTKAMEHFKAELEKRSNGAFNVMLKPNNEAGGEEKIMELVKRGALQTVMVGGLLKDDEPMIAAFEQPFIVDGWDHAKAIYLSEGIKKFQGDYTKKTGVIVNGYVVNGFRQVSCNFALNSMADLGKMKIRTPLSEVFVQLFKALGSNPTPMPMTELYTAMETKVVDGQDNPYSTVKAMGWWEVQGYMLESRHVFSPTSVLTNGKFYNDLPADLKKLYDTVLQEAILLSWDLSRKDEQESIDFLKSKNIKITVPDEAFKKQMRDAAKPVYDWFDKEIKGSKEFREYCLSKKK